jgi:predicted PurR-regulated permease PerM
MADRSNLPRAKRSIRVDLTSKTMLVVVATCAAVWLAIELFPVVIVVVVALMIAGAVSPMVAWLDARRVHRTTAVLFVFAAMLVVVALVGILTLPRLFAQVTGIVDRLPQMQTWLADHLQRSRWSAPLAQSVRGTRIPEVIAQGARAAISYSPQIVEVVGGAVTAAFLALYVLIDRDRLRGGLFALVARRHHVRLSRILLGLETIVGGYVRGQVITSVLIMVFTFAVLTAAGVDNAIAYAVFAGLTDVLPYIGGLLATGPAVLATLEKGATATLVVLALLVAYQEFESRIIVPRVYGRVLRLPSSIVIVALLAGGKLMGILGALLALPLAAGIRMVAEELRFEMPGEPPEDPALKARDEQGEREYQARARGVPAAEAAEIATEIAERTEEDHLPSEPGEHGESHPG